MSDQARRRRDPEARRSAIVTAAAELITEVGVDAITHRMVASRADVPLGATTQYFATLDELRTAALDLLAAHVDEQMAIVRAELQRSGIAPATLAAVLHRALADARAVQADRAVVTAAVHDPRLRDMAQGWSQQVRDLLAPTFGVQRAAAAAVFIDGVLIHTQITDDPLERHIIEIALAGILGEPRTT